MTKQLTEQAAITEAAAAKAKETGRMPVQFISPGWGSSGYYSPEVIAEAAESRFIPAGTHMYADHPTDTERIERPGRSIKDLMAVVAEDAHLSPDGALVGEVDVVPAWRPLLETVREHIGVSILGSATDIVEGEAEGRRGGIIEGLVAPCFSVDFVTKAGRGGKVLPLMESAAANQRAIAHGVAEATVNDTREALQTALRDAHAAAEDVYLWVRDFDDTTVWFELEGRGAGDDQGVYGQSYSEADGVVTLSGTRTEVRVQTKYVPVTRPDSTNPTTTESEEDNMGNIQIEESEHRSLVEKAGRVDTLVTERDTAIAERDTARGELAAYRRRDAAAKIVGEAKVGDDKVAFTTLETRGLLADLPVKEGTDELDVDAFTTTVAEAAATALADRGAGTVSGFGGITVDESAGLTPEVVGTTIGEAFGRTQTQIKGA